MPESYNGVESHTTILFQMFQGLCRDILTMRFKAMDYAWQELNVFCSPPPFWFDEFFSLSFLPKKTIVGFDLSASRDFGFSKVALGFSISKRSLYNCFSKSMKNKKLCMYFEIVLDFCELTWREKDFFKLSSSLYTSGLLKRPQKRQNLHLKFDVCLVKSNLRWRFWGFCGLLRKHEP